MRSASLLEGFAQYVITPRHLPCGKLIGCLPQSVVLHPGGPCIRQPLVIWKIPVSVANSCCESKLAFAQQTLNGLP